VTVNTTTSLSANDTNSTHDIYLYDLVTLADGIPFRLAGPTLVSQSLSGAAGNADSLFSVPSDDGNLVVFASDASDLVANDVNGCRDVFLFDRTRVARSSHYGSGYAGPHPIPTMSVDVAPTLGASINLSITNSSGVPVTALVFVGVDEASVALPWGATLLVDLSTALHFLVPLGAGGGTLQSSVPGDPAYSGLSVYLQALEYDDAVTRKLAFTNGLALHFGN